MRSLNLNHLKIAAVAGILAAGLYLSPAARAAQSTANTTASATATIKQPIQITKAADMAFGTVFVSSSAPEAVTIDSTGAVKSGGTYQTGTTSAASFDISGEDNALYQVTIDKSITLTSGLNTMTVDTLTSNLGDISTGTLGSLALSAAGTATLNVGGTLEVAQSQASGTYTGTLNVTVTYQ